MRLRTSAILSADARAVWPFLADPELQAKWNPRIVAINRDRSGPARQGERFEMLYRMSGRERESHVSVTTCQPLQRIVFLHEAAGQSTRRTVEEAYEIVPCGRGVKVVQVIDLGGAGIPWPFRALVWVISRWGWNAETPSLEGLRPLVEPSTNAP